MDKCKSCGQSTKDMSGTASVGVGGGSAFGKYLASRTWRCNSCGSSFCLNCAEKKLNYKCSECGGSID